jgi:hypothetical protein
MNISSSMGREAENDSRKQRLANADLPRGDEAKAGSARGAMAVRRLLAAAAGRSVTYDLLLSEHETQSLFDCGASWFGMPVN